ncbi:MAG: triose-phosphate isomerase [Planctomycetes bacterium]|jgi:triosephosphate isomerase|nr:triose-phosphate isomerase [Planctomycetota bacterium]
MRKPFLAGNWKMNLDRRSGVALARTLAARSVTWSGREVAIFPAFVYLDEIVRATAGSGVRVGAQNLCDEKSGAFTGEVSAAMLKDVGATLVLCGHSERRHLYGEDDRLVNRKLHAALSQGLDVILCVGETLEERKSGSTEARLSRQMTLGLAGVSAEDLARITIAYEPVWAIGTGVNASPAQAGEAHTYLRGLLSGLYGESAAAAVRIQYGGSVKADNIQTLMRAPNVDGALVGGASLQSESFLGIVEVAL